MSRINAHPFAETSYYENALVPTNLKSGWICYLEDVSHFQVQARGGGTTLAATRFQFHVLGRTPKELPEEPWKSPQDQIVFTIWNAAALHASGRFPEDLDAFKSKHLVAYWLGRAVTKAANLDFDINTYLSPAGDKMQGTVHRIYNQVAAVSLPNQPQQDKTKFKQNLIAIFPEEDEGLVKKAKEAHESDSAVRIKVQEHLEKRRQNRKNNDPVTTVKAEEAGIASEDMPF